MANFLASLLGLFGGPRTARAPAGSALIEGDGLDTQIAEDAADAFATAGPRVPGWFGKLPVLGDFASRRLPDAFIARWDTWLAQGMQAGADAHGEAWNDTFARAPAWRFVLAPGVIDANPWIGVLVPSADKVGRVFPLTIALPLRARATPAGALGAWLDAATQAAVGCKDAAASIERLDEALAELGEPPFAETDAGGDGVAARWPAGESAEATFGAALPWFLSELRGSSFWWPHGNAADAAIWVVRGLPAAARFAKMTAGTL